MTFDPRRPDTLGLRQRWEVKIKNLIRRMDILSSKGLSWDLAGYPGEVDEEVDNFPGIGFGSRPRPGSGEVLYVQVGAAVGYPAVVATRDAEIAMDLESDETAIFTSQAMVKITKDREILIGSRGGSFEPLVKKSEFEAHTHKYTPALHPGATNSIETASTDGIAGTISLRAD